MAWNPNPQNWKRRYEETGYLVVEDAVDDALLLQMRCALERIEQAWNEGTLPPGLHRWIARERDRTRGASTGESGSDAISNIMELPLFDPVFSQLIVYPRVLDILEALFSTSEFAFHNYKCICKMPGNQAHFQWHRDLPYLQHTTTNLLTCMLCVDEMTAENGATVVCPGSHRVPAGEVKPGDTDIDPSQVPAQRVTVTCPAGAAVVFHVNIIHGGPPNVSQDKRRNVIGIWSGPDAFPTTAARYAYQGVMPRSRDPRRQKQIQMTFG